MQDTDTHSSPAGDMQFLSFQLGGREYGLDFQQVQQLRSLRTLERVAADGEILSGVAVSRGVIMPIVDMRMAFRGTPGRTGPITDVIVLQLSSCIMGMVVDGVTDVVHLRADQIAPIPGNSGANACDYLLGLGELDGRRLILVDIDKLMSIRRVDEGATVEQAA